MELSDKAKKVYDSWLGTTIIADKNGWDIVGAKNEHFDNLEELNKFLEKIAEKLEM